MDRITTARSVALALNDAVHACVRTERAGTSMHSATGEEHCQHIPPNRQPCISMTRDTTTFDCEAYRAHPHPGMVRYRRGIENTPLRNEARSQGAPRSFGFHRYAAGPRYSQRPSNRATRTWAGKQ